MDIGDEDRFRHRYNLNSRIMITATVCLFFVVVVIVVLHFYARYVLRRQAMRRQAIHQLAISTAAAQVNSSEQTRAGLDAAVIASLPIFIYKLDDQVSKDSQVDRDCAVCLSNLEEGEVARLLPNCKHIFHSKCVDAWLRAHTTCPICRTEAKPRVHPDSVEVGVVVAATAPPVDSVNYSAPCSEGTSDDLGQPSKALGSSSRLSSFKRILSREKSDRRSHSISQTESIRDLETQ